ncbi:MAG: hypothetical protein ABIJ56_15755 [Pseudomonadota bacterium]
MANTKKLTREQRKATKRKARRALKSTFGSLSYKDRKAFHKAKKSDKKTFTGWLREKEEAAKEAAKAETKPEAGEKKE